jgi:ornithine cyclodeaminase/alanine dehydrogenase-like protein (mu-crystallin family)
LAFSALVCFGWTLLTSSRLGELLAPDARQKHSKRHLHDWLQTGNVIYKSVGVGLMDLAVGMFLIEYAKTKGVGTYVQGF